MVNWINLSQSAGTSGTTVVTITASSYEELTARTSSLRVSTVNTHLYEDVNILQNPRERIEVSVNPSAITAEMSGGTFTIDITCNGDWEITSFPSGWTISQSAGTGNGQITITIPANNGLAIDEEIVIVGKYNGTIDSTITIPVHQKGIELEVSPTSLLDITDEGAVYTFSVSSNTEWTITSYPNWVSFDSLSGSGNGSVIATFSPNDGAARTGQIIFTSNGNLITVTINLRQNAYNTDYSQKYLTIEASSSGTIYFFYYASDSRFSSQTIEVSKNGGAWYSVSSFGTPDTGPKSVIAQVVAGDKIRLKGDNNCYADNQIYSEATCSVYGNINSLIDSINFSQMSGYTNSNSYCFAQFFYRNPNIIDASNLILSNSVAPAISCYSRLFSGCTGLVSAPEIQSTTVVQSCYSQMFAGCTSLVNAPSVLPATNLQAADGCYTMMFMGCTNLVNAPVLPATTIGRGSYQQMFEGCTSLLFAPELPATTLGINSYYKMFSGCTNLYYIKSLATNISASACTYKWVDGVANKGFFIKDSSMIYWNRNTSGIPSGWTVYDSTDVVTIPTLSISPTYIDNAPANGSAYTITITSNTGWTVSTTDSFVSLSTSAGTGNAVITVTLAANTTRYSRIGHTYIETTDGVLTRETRFNQTHN